MGSETFSYPVHKIIPENDLHVVFLYRRTTNSIIYIISNFRVPGYAGSFNQVMYEGLSREHLRTSPGERNEFPILPGIQPGLA